MLNKLRKEIFFISLYGLIFWMLVVAIFSLSDEILNIGILVFVVFSIFGLSDYLYSKTRVGRQFGLIKAHYFSPKPLTTMLDSLVSNGYLIAEIDSIFSVSYDLKATCKYLDESKAAEYLFKKNKEIKFNIIGYSSDGIVYESEKYPRILTQTTKDKLSEHKNIIIMKNGDTLLWYEPHHIISDRKHTFNQGAYLIKISKDKKYEIEKEYEELIVA
jgi:hypothetical protein